MKLENLFSATDATKFLGLKHRQYFYKVKKLHPIEPAAKLGSIPLYSLADLKKLKKTLAASE